jgi:hypothetical protein
MSSLDPKLVFVSGCPRCSQNNLGALPCFLCDNQRIRYTTPSEFIPLSAELTRVQSGGKINVD